MVSWGWAGTRLYVVTTMCYAAIRNGNLHNGRGCPVRGALDDLARVTAAPLLWPAYVCYDFGPGARPALHFQRARDND